MVGNMLGQLGQGLFEPLPPAGTYYCPMPQGLDAPQSLHAGVFNVIGAAVGNALFRGVNVGSALSETFETFASGISSGALDVLREAFTSYFTGR